MSVRLPAALTVHAVLLALAGSASAAAPAVEEHPLANGLRVLLAPDDALDDVSIVVRYGVGSADDPPGREGLAHLVEHMMFEGSKHVPKGEHLRLLESAGGWGTNARTAEDATTYFETVPPSRLPLALWLESDRMGYLRETVVPAEVVLERGIVIDEHRDRIVDNAFGALAVAIQDEVFPSWHPYHFDTTEDTIGDLTPDDVRAFLHTWYSPSNATLAIAGHFDPRATLDLATHYFGALPSTPAPTRPALTRWIAGDTRVDMEVRLVHDTVTMVWPTAALGAPGDDELDLVATLLTGTGGVLRRALVDKGLALAVSSGQRSLDRVSEFTVSATVAPGISSEDVVRVMGEAIAGLAKGIDKERLAYAQQQWRGALWLRLETSAGRASRLAGMAAPLPKDWGLDRYAHFDEPSVLAAARTWLAPQQRTTIVTHRKKTAPAMGEVTQRQRRLP